MNQVDQNINKDMIDSDLIDVESLDFSDDQTWLYTVPGDSGQRVDIIEWNLSCDWPFYEDAEYLKSEKELYSLLDSIIKTDDVALPDKHKFDSRTFVKPKKRVQRPSIQSIVEATSNPPSITLTQPANKYLTYNKYTNPLGPISPMLRLKTFTVDTNTDNSNAAKRRSIALDDDPQLEDLDVGMTGNVSDRLSGHVGSKPINIDLSQPAHNLHNTFNKGVTNMLNDRGSLNMYQSGESLMRMSPPSLVSSLLMESSGTFNTESLDSRKSMPFQKDSGLPMSGRESIDPMMTSMTLSILDEKDMSTSFLSQTTYPDNDSLLDSLPPSLVNSVNSSHVNTSKTKAETTDTNIFSSATFTHLEQSERLLSARPRCQLYNSYTKREPGIRSTESYIKSREEACQIDQVKILNDNSDRKDSPNITKVNEMSETITLHYSNNKYQNNDAEKENFNETFNTDDAFYKENGIQKTNDAGKISLNVTLDKQELNEIKQARQKLSLARKGLPTEPDKPLPNQVDVSPNAMMQVTSPLITVTRQSIENGSDVLKRRSMNLNNYEEVMRETPKRNATFRKLSPRQNAMDTTVVYVKGDENKIIDINSATMNLIDSGEKIAVQDDWGSQERAMVGSSESTDTGTFSSSSPPESVPETAGHPHDRNQIASTPLMTLKNSQNDLMNIHTTISPIYDTHDDKSYTLTKAQSTGLERTYDLQNTTLINTATMVKTKSAKRDILAGQRSPEKISGPSTAIKPPSNRISPPNVGPYNSMAPPLSVPKKTGLPTSKLRQYSSHKELNRIPGSGAPSGIAAPRTLVGRVMVRRGVYASNPALSPTTPTPPQPYALPARPSIPLPKTAQPTPIMNTAPPVRRDSYTVAVDQAPPDDKDKQTQKPSVPTLVRQGTETLRRERPQSQLVAPRDVSEQLRASGVTTGVPLSIRNHYMFPPSSRPQQTASATITRVSRPTSVPAQRPVPVTTVDRPVTAAENRVSGLPRPSRLPAPRRALRPPSVYSVAPTADVDHY